MARPLRLPTRRSALGRARAPASPGLRALPAAGAATGRNRSGIAAFRDASAHAPARPGFRPASVAGCSTATFPACSWQLLRQARSGTALVFVDVVEQAFQELLDVALHALSA